MSKPFYVNPVQVCSELHGYQNLNEVRNCIMNSIYRFYGPFCDFHQAGLYNMIQSYMVEIIKNAGRNPKALKLPLSIPIFEPRFFVTRYFELLDKEKAYQYCLQDCGDNKDCQQNCYVDKNSMY
jgi:hypothetical protein